MRPRRYALQRWLERAVGMVSRIVDDFEVNPGSPRTASNGRSLRMLTAQTVRWQRSWGP